MIIVHNLVRSRLAILLSLTVISAFFYYEYERFSLVAELVPILTGAGQNSTSHDPATASVILEVTLYPKSSAFTPAPWRGLSERALLNLRECMGNGTCTENQKKVVLIQSMYFGRELSGALGGEDIWAHSTARALRNLDFTLLYGEDLEELLGIYRLLPHLVRIAIVDDWQTFECWRDKTHCLRSDRNPTGIPGYKLLSFYYWPYPRHPLGPRWILSPEPYQNQVPAEPRSNNTYLGYSIEETCRKTAFVPASERPNDPPQAWVLAKLLSYFVQGMHGIPPSWSKDDFDALAQTTGLQLRLAAAGPSEDSEGIDNMAAALPDAAHYVNTGRLAQDVFMASLARTRVVIGIGNPIISPTPWNALCLGVPFINPILEWDQEHPDDPQRWRTQHPLAALLPKPYVYNVRKGDRQGLIAAVVAALANPIEPFVPGNMTMRSIEARIADIVETDWEAEERRQREWCKELCGCQQPCDAENYDLHEL